MKEGRKNNEPLAQKIIRHVSGVIILHANVVVTPENRDRKVIVEDTSTN
jgi:hypothetical protein